MGALGHKLDSRTPLELFARVIPTMQLEVRNVGYLPWPPPSESWVAMPI